MHWSTLSGSRHWRYSDIRRPSCREKQQANRLATRPIFGLRNDLPRVIFLGRTRFDAGSSLFQVQK